MCAATNSRSKTEGSPARDQRSKECAPGPNCLVILDRNSKTIQRFKPENDEWHTTENGFTEEMGSWSFSAAVYKTSLVIFMNNKAVYRFQRTSKGAKWHRMPDMKFNHGQRPPVVVFNDTFFVIGSAGVGAPVDFGERYSIARKAWIPIKNMLTARRNGALVSTDGGFVNSKQRNDLFCLSMPSGMCISLKAMNMRRSVFIACIIDGKIFAVGGDNSCHDSVEVYDAEKDEWKFMDIFSTLEIDAAVAMVL